MEKKMTVQEIVELIRSNKGKIFSVTFIKRTTGEERTMVCRLQVSKGVTGEGLKFDPTQKALLVAYDVQKEAFRMINLATVKSIRMEGIEVTV